MMEIQHIKVEKEDEWEIQTGVIVKKEEILPDDSEVKVSGEDHKNRSDITGIKQEVCPQLVQFEITEVKEEVSEANQSSQLDAGQSNTQISEIIRCIYCEGTFKHRTSLTRHRKFLHRGFPIDYTGGSIQCEICQKVCDGVETLAKHVQESHHIYQFECAHCGRKYGSLHSLRQHLGSHVTERLFRCDVCPKTFKTKGNLSSHMKVVHVTKEIQCPQCLKMFKSESHLRNHSFVHGSDLSFKCHQCEKTFKSPTGLRNHMKKYHSKEKDVRHEKNFSCPICLKSYGTKYNLKDHIQKTHSDEKHVECHVCHKKFKYSQSLKIHLQLHEPQIGVISLKCPQCPKFFKRPYLLQEHIRLHHSGECSCPICGRIFSNKYLLKKHAPLHDLSMLQCHLCVNTYKKRDSFIGHLILVHKFTQDAAEDSFHKEMARHKERKESQTTANLAENPEGSLETVIVKTEYEITEIT